MRFKIDFSVMLSDSILDNDLVQFLYIFHFVKKDAKNLRYQRKLLIFIILIYGIVFDILYSNIFLLNTSLLFLILFIFYLYYKKYKFNNLSFIFLSLLLIYLYVVVLYLFNIIRFTNIYLFVFINLIYYLISFIVLRSRIFTKKVKINY